MPSFHGKLLKGDQLIADGVPGTLWTSAGSWGGNFELPPGVAPPSGWPYRLVLDDGRSGEIHIGGASVTAGQPTTVFFVGIGKPP